mmetsp:Transcript_19999/g.65152  ORF Transcript_19999/g.65152 Transcript_19999/m.65152 type:complete len:225 (+) Transcript_19999:2512-3186(+)
MSAPVCSVSGRAARMSQRSISLRSERGLLTLRLCATKLAARAWLAEEATQAPMLRGSEVACIRFSRTRWLALPWTQPRASPPSPARVSEPWSSGISFRRRAARAAPLEPAARAVRLATAQQDQRLAGFLRSAHRRQRAVPFHARSAPGRSAQCRSACSERLRARRARPSEGAALWPAIRTQCQMRAASAKKALCEAVQGSSNVSRAAACPSKTIRPRSCAPPLR